MNMDRAHDREDLDSNTHQLIHMELSLKTTQHLQLQVEDDANQAHALTAVLPTNQNSPRRTSSNRNSHVALSADCLCSVELHEVSRLGSAILEGGFPDSDSADASRQDGCEESHNGQLNVEELNMKQKEVVDMYCAYLKSDNANYSTALLPEITLLTGPSGTGKSHVITAISQLANELGRRHDVINTAYNNMNALAIDGPTLTVLGSLTATSHQELPEFTSAEFGANFDRIRAAKIIVIDEISNVSPYVLACLQQVCQCATGNYNMCFGGIHLLLVGDLCQKNPVFGLPLARAVLQVRQHQRLVEA